MSVYLKSDKSLNTVDEEVCEHPWKSFVISHHKAVCEDQWECFGTRLVVNK